MPRKIEKPRTASQKELVNIRMQRYRRPKKKEDWVARLKRKVKVYFSKRAAPKTKKDYVTARTKSVSDDLRAAGLTEADLKRLRGKK